MVKLGMIGCGGIANLHARVVAREVRGMRVAAASDINETALAAFGKEHAVDALYTDYRAMLRKADVDAVCVALPTGLHRRAAVAAAKAGKHVFCEKPMAMSLRDADAIIEACAKAGVKLMVGQVRRYDAFWGAFKKLIDSGAIGRPVLWRQTNAGAGPGRWFMDAKMGGGPFMDGCVHNWDFANYVFGEPVDAVGTLMSLSEGSAFDAGSVSVRYRGGDQIVLAWCWGLPKGCRGQRAHDALGPKGVIHFPGGFPSSEFPEGFDHDKYGAFLVDTGARNRLVKFRKNSMFGEEWKDFRDCVVKDREPKVTGLLAQQAAAVALAAIQAGATRKTVKIAKA